MATRQFEPGRAVEVISPTYGSAYRIGGRLVLTAAHLLAEVGSECRLRSKQSFGEAEGRVVWKAQTGDIALVELPERIGACEAVVLGSLPEAAAGEYLDFHMYGYPRWGRTRRESGGTAAGGRQIMGVIYLADTSPDGLLVLEAGRLPPEMSLSSGSEWEGNSGAAIVCDGLVVAVQRQHQNPKRPASLEAEVLEKIYDDRQWRALLEQHGISPEPATARLPLEQSKDWFLQGTGNAAVFEWFSKIAQHLVNNPDLSSSEKMHELDQAFLIAKEEDSLLASLTSEELQSIRDSIQGRLDALQYLQDDQQRKICAKATAHECYEFIVKYQPNSIEQALEVLSDNLEFVLKWLYYSLRDYADYGLEERSRYNLKTIPEDLRHEAFVIIERKIEQKTHSHSARREAKTYLNILLKKTQE